MDQMEENEIELETVVIDDTADEILPLSTEKIANTNIEEANKVEKIVRFPVTRIKHLVKMDPDVNLCSQEALFLITKTTVSQLLHTICLNTSQIISLCSGVLC